MRHVSLAGLVALVVVLVPVATPAQDVRAGVEQLATQIVKSAPGDRQVRIAVADFPDLQGVVSELGRFVASRLTTRLTQSPRFFVIERQRLSQVLAELKFSMSDLVDPAKARQLGQMAGVEVIVVGSIADLGNQVDMDARVIDIETTQTVVGASATISKDQVVAQMLEKGRQDVSARPLGAVKSASPPGAAATGQASVTLQKWKDFEFQLSGCQPLGRGAACRFVVTNHGLKQEGLSISADRARLYDDLGNNYRGHRVRFGDREGQGVHQLLLPGVPLKAAVTFEEIAPGAAQLTLGLACSDTCGMVFRKIPLQK